MTEKSFGIISVSSWQLQGRSLEQKSLVSNTGGALGRGTNNEIDEYAVEITE